MEKHNFLMKGKTRSRTNCNLVFILGRKVTQKIVETMNLFSTPNHLARNLVLKLTSGRCKRAVSFLSTVSLLIDSKLHENPGTKNISKA